MAALSTHEDLEVRVPSCLDCAFNPFETKVQKKYLEHEHCILPGAQADVMLARPNFGQKHC